MILTFVMLAVSAPALAQSGEDAAQSADKAGAQDTQIQSLIDAIKNDDTRQKLVDALEKVKAPESDKAKESADAAAKTPAGAGSDRSVGRQVAEFTQSIADEASRSTMRFAQQLASIPTRFSALGPSELSALGDAARDVGLVIVITYVIFFLLRQLSLRLYRRIGAVAEDSGIFRRLVLIVVSALIDAGVVLLAWALGYLATTLVGTFGSVGIRQSLYLNAFVLVELFKVALRIILSPATEDLRLVNISDAAARLLNNRLTWIASLLGYGQLFITPVLNQSVSFAAGQAASILLALVALVIAVWMTVRNRHRVQAWLIGETSDLRTPSRFVLALTSYWYVIVLIYFAFLFIVVLTRPASSLMPILAATGEVILALIVGFGITGWIARASARGINLPENVSQKLPLLETRLNRFVPKFLTVVRVVVALAVLVFALHAIGVISLTAWMESQVGVQATTAIISVVAILLVAFAIWLAMTSWVDYRLNPDFGSVPTTRETTLLSLLRNAATIALLIITLMFALSEVGINIAPLIASAGVLGLAIGFGAQKLVQDIITGVFIQLENAINVGDVVTTGGVTGVAERLTIRSVSLRDLDGTYHIIPFSSVDMVSNFMKEFSYSVCNMGVAYRESYDEVKDAMFEAFELLRNDPDSSAPILGDMEWFGVTQFGDSAVVVRTRIKTLPGSQWGVGRAYNRYVKQVFDERNIEIPFPHQTLYFGEDKKGNAPVAHVRVGKDSEGVEPTTAKSAPASDAQRDTISNVPPDNAEGDDAAETDH